MSRENPRSIENLALLTEIIGKQGTDAPSLPETVQDLILSLMQCDLESRVSFAPHLLSRGPKDKDGKCRFEFEPPQPGKPNLLKNSLYEKA